MLSVSSDRSIEPLTLAILREVEVLVKELSLSYFVAGAMARDILLTGVFGISTGRATQDVDFAIAVNDWPHFEAIKARLIERGCFEAAPKATHRMYFKLQPEMQGYPLDIIPFRGVEETSNTIKWPPDMMIMMNVVGYEEALAAAQSVELEPGFKVKVASLPGLALLKVFAWLDRGSETFKDALDLVTLFRNYAEAGNLIRLYGEAAAVLEKANFDLTLAAPRLLGWDVRAIASPSTLEQLQSILNDSKLMDRLATNMARGLRSADDGVSEALRLLEQFKC
jgi:predicted nucleotidyltransferase